MTHPNFLQQADGIVVALPTPYNPDGTVAAGVLRALTGHLLGQGVDGFYVSGSTGDGVVLDEEDRVLCIRAVNEITAGEVPVFAHVGSNSTDQTLRLADRAVKAGADAVSSIVPGLPLTPDEMLDFFRELIQSSPAPFIAYNFPARSGVGLSIEALGELVKEPNLYGLKNTSSDLFEMSAFTRLREGRFRVWNGRDEIIQHGLSVGACGAIGSTFNLCPRLYIDLAEQHHAGNYEEAQALQRKVEAYVRVLVSHGVMPSLRALLTADGFDMGPARRPFHDLGDTERTVLLEEISGLDLPRTPVANV